MAKIVRVSYPSRGKKLIIGDSDYGLFSTSVRQKFLLDPDAQISFEDKYGTEVDEDIFPILLQQHSIPNVTVKIFGEVDVIYVGRGGLIQARLRHIHKSINKDKPKVERKRALPRTEISSIKRVPVGSEVADNSTLYLIRKLSSLCPKTAEQEIKRPMQETFPHRSVLRQTNQLGILNTYNKFLECDFLINFEFSLMHENSVKNFVDIWPAAATKIVQKAPKISRTPALQKFVLEESNNWDINISALFTLLYLIPPAPQGQGRGSRSNITDAKELLISFFKLGTPLQSILDTWADKKSQPNLVCLGDNKKDLISFFIVCDRKILPIAAQNSAEAIDTLFKSHYVFATEYDNNLSGLWKFIQVYLYKLELETTPLPRKVKQVYSQLASIFEVLEDC